MSVEERRPMTREIHGQQTGKIFEVSISPYHSAEGNFIGSVAIIKDVTEKKENEMRSMMSERFVALGEMASGIAHELNNPLATIAACTEALLNRMEKEKIGSILFESYLKMIEEEINRCKSITTGLLSFVRKADNEKKDVDINEALDGAIEMVAFQGRLRNVVYLRNFKTEMPQVKGNESELRQAFLTIIVNALDAMDDRGTLTIETGTMENTVFTKISDTGFGIPSGLINRIFDPFFSTKSEKGGTGLGLSIAKKIIEENHGKIDVISEKGSGATFTITLPI
jgi:two-component system NtrC family sensor kinase